MTDFTRRVYTRPFVCWLAGGVGAVFLLVGILGFIPGITTDYDQLKFADHDSTAELLGTFQVSILHNIVHILFGLAGLALMRQAKTAQGYLIVGGALYLALWVYGLAIDFDSTANFLPLNDADNWLHLCLGAVMVIGGLLPLATNNSRRLT